MDFWTALFLFLAGVLSQRLGSYLFLYSKKVLFFNDVAFAGLRIFKFVNDSAEEANKLKYKSMETHGFKEEDIEEEKEADEKMLQLWREIAIAGTKAVLPPTIRPMLKFNTWEEAMRLLINRDRQQGK
jgi:hypothetical protein